MAPKAGGLKFRKSHASESSEQVPAWLKAMENKLEVKFDDLSGLLESRLQAKIDDLGSAKAEVLAALETKVSSLQEEIQQKSKRAKAPLLEFHENVKLYDCLNELEDCFLDLERHLQSHGSLDATTRDIIARGNSCKRKKIICIRDREGPRIAEFYEMGEFGLFDFKNSPKIGLDGPVVTLS